MTQAEIRQKHKALCAERDAIKEQLEDKQTEIKRLQKRCEHPRKHNYSCMGEMGASCPDCGWSI